MSETDLRAALQRAKETIQQQQEFIDKVMVQASPYSLVAYVADERCVLIQGGGLLEVERPATLEVRPGMTVKVAPQSGQIVEAGITDLPGIKVKVVEIVCDTRARVARDASSVTVFKDPSLEVKKGDTVEVDPSCSVIIAVVESEAADYVRKGTGVTWDDIGGLEAVKKQLVEIVELPHREPEIFKYYGYTPPKGVLLSGPPGCGKTMLGKATATAIAAATGGESGFIYVKGPEVLNKFVGESEAKVRSLFAQARAHKERTGAPAVIFIDEAEALLSSRGADHRIVGMERTIVPTFLAEMDGLDESSAVVILATNRPEQLDSAIVRDGRIDRKIDIGRPDAQAIAQIAALNLRGVPIHGTTLEEAARAVVREFLSPERVIYHVDGADGQRRAMRLVDVVSGAMVANVVERAKSAALHRDLESRKKTGVTVEDLVSAIDVIMAESKRIDHSEEIKDFIRATGVDARGVSRVAQLAA